MFKNYLLDKILLYAYKLSAIRYYGIFVANHFFAHKLVCGSLGEYFQGNLQRCTFVK